MRGDPAVMRWRWKGRANGKWGDWGIGGLDAGFQIPDARFRMPDIRCRIPDARYRSALYMLE